MMKDEEVVKINDSAEEIIQAIKLSESVLNSSEKLMKHKSANNQLLIDELALQLITDSVKSTLELNNFIIRNKDVLKPDNSLIDICNKISEESKNLTLNTDTMKNNNLESIMNSWSNVHGLGLALAITIIRGVESDLKKAN